MLSLLSGGGLIRALGVCAFIREWQKHLLYREMMKSIPERDWKYLSSVKGDMLETLCERINDEVCRIVADQASSQHERFLRLHGHLIKGDEVVARCFDDWRRSNILEKLVALYRHRLLTNEHLARLSRETWEMLRH